MGAGGATSDFGREGGGAAQPPQERPPMEARETERARSGGGGGTRREQKGGGGEGHPRSGEGHRGHRDRPPPRPRSERTGD